jgi:hypothetical protein
MSLEASMKSFHLGLSAAQTQALRERTELSVKNLEQVYSFSYIDFLIKMV